MRTSLLILVMVGTTALTGAWTSPWHRSHRHDKQIRDSSISASEQIKATSATPAPPSNPDSIPYIRRSSQNPSSWSPYLNLPHYRGINVVNLSPAINWTGVKNATDWQTAFRLVKNLPGGFNAVRLYSTTETGDALGNHHLEHALPAARDNNISLHVGIWSGGDSFTSRFNDEKSALDRALANNYGCDNIIAVSVGNEDMYNNRTDTGNPQAPLASVNLLIDQINVISAILDSHGCCSVPVTHADTAGMWMEPQAVALIQAVDFLTVNLFPYWSGSNINDANSTFWSELNDSIAHANQYGKEVWIGETGWPHFGETQKEQAEASPANQERYFNEVACSLFPLMNTFYYVSDDVPDATVNGKKVPAFGIWDEAGNQPRFDMSCSSSS